MPRLLRRCAPTDLHPAVTRTERFVYVVRDDTELIASGRTERVGAGTLVAIPAGERHVPMQAVGPADAALAEFSPERR
jgi:hypothetical protein